MAQNSADSKASSTLKTFDSHDNSLLLEVAAHEPIDLVNAIRNCRSHGEKWSGFSLEKRKEICLLFCHRLLEELDELLLFEARETGVPVGYLQTISKQDVLSALEIIKEASERPGISLGLCAVFLPRVLVLETLLPSLLFALVQGNSLIVKPSSRSFATAKKIEEILEEFDELTKVVRFIYSDRNHLGGLLAQHPGVDGIYFTGRYTSLEQMDFSIKKRLLSRTGGQNSAIVLEDAPLEETANSIARQCFVGQGLLPQNISRIFVHHKVFAEFSEYLKKSFASLRVGPATDPESEFSGFPSHDTQEQAMNMIGLSEKENGKVFWAGSNDSANYAGASPQVMEDLTFCSELHQQDFQAPLVLINEIKYAHEAISWTNTNPFGRRAAIFTSKPERREKLAGKLQVSEVSSEFSPELERRSGIGWSGYGACGQRDIFDFFTHSRVITS